ncbi:MAG: phosphoribosyltransferase family protein [Dehalococcoidales bacterium]|nr:phosphoribosyltransferase family protein [Dehalococcoidales bacterium]
MAGKSTAQLRILSRSDVQFADREEAGRLLAVQLSEYRGQNAVVLGIPRGGIIVAREVARALDAELDIVLAHKLRTPGYEELAMGSVAEDGKLFINRDVAEKLGVGEAYIQQEKARQMAEIKRRTELFRRARPRVPLKGRTVIVTDDGVATGATTQAALWAVRLEQPQKLIAAIPVGPEDTIRRLAGDVDEMLCLRAPPLFAAVGQFYQQFYPVEDEDVLRILREEHKDG